MNRTTNMIQPVQRAEAQGRSIRLMGRLTVTALDATSTTRHGLCTLMPNPLRTAEAATWEKAAKVADEIARDYGAINNDVSFNAGIRDYCAEATCNRIADILRCRAGGTP